MKDQWSVLSFGDIVVLVLSAWLVYAAIIIYTRLAGLRSFSKMSAPDFAMTLAVGSLFASSISAPRQRMIAGLIALAVLFLTQQVIAWIRTRISPMRTLIDNRPVLLMAGDQILGDNLKRVNVTRSDLMAKLREANAVRRSDVIAVVFETTGDISVLHGDHDSVDPELFSGVDGAERLKLKSAR
ncbi:DUF421 domain-containing protein [Crateriforma conspicua]|uniref:DUF421 domain-containing protein n=1 Tax=Crateriforma conspicua TaxID=2527996 RepID=UPI00118CDA5C|nr:YetF domain-containing protein [Crateriforma conspicua]QDV63531.1 hypothetical protein Mal65_26750 [Crateriforma conspicua]